MTGLSQGAEGVLPVDARPAARSGARVWLLPSFGLFLFIVHPIRLLFTPDAMLRDPGIGWHLQSGRYMLEHGELLRHDPFTFTKPEGPWVVFAWLFQCAAAALEQLGGLPLLTAACALVFASLPVLLYRRMLRDQVNIYVAFLLSSVAYFGLVWHALARPHIFTYVFFTLLLERLTLFDQGRLPSKPLYLFCIPLMAIWVNVHGGFSVGLAVVGIFFLVALIQSLATGSADAERRARTFLLLGGGMGLASLLNPRGWDLHLFVVDVLDLESTRGMREFQSPDFSSGHLALYLFEALLLASLILLRRQQNRVSWTECALLAFFLSQSLHAVRHVMLFIILAIPIIGRELSGWLATHQSWLTRRAARASIEQSRLKGDRLWIPALSLVFLVLSQAAPGLFRHDLYGLFLSRDAATYISEHQDRFRRMFNTTDVGGTLTYHFWPELQIFGDDRNPYYGDEFYVDEYFEVLWVRPKWQEVLDKYDVTAAVVGTYDPAVSTLFKTSPRWDLVFEDDKNTLFVRRTENGFGDDET